MGVLCFLSRQHEVVQEERGELGPPLQPGLPVDLHGVLPHRPFRPFELRGRLLVPRSLEDQQCHVALGAGEVPGVELPIDGVGEARSRGFGAAPPRVALRLPLRHQMTVLLPLFGLGALIAIRRGARVVPV